MGGGGTAGMRTASPAWNAHRNKSGGARVVVVLGQGTGQRSISLDVSPYATLYSVKERVVEAVGLPPEEQLLLFQVVPARLGAAYGAEQTKRELLRLPNELGKLHSEMKRVTDENLGLKEANALLQAENDRLKKEALERQASRHARPSSAPTGMDTAKPTQPTEGGARAKRVEQVVIAGRKWCVRGSEANSRARPRSRSTQPRVAGSRLPENKYTKPEARQPTMRPVPPMPTTPKAKSSAVGCAPAGTPVGAPAIAAAAAQPSPATREAPPLAGVVGQMQREVLAAVAMQKAFRRHRVHAASAEGGEARG